MGIFGDVWDGAKDIGGKAFGLTPLGVAYNVGDKMLSKGDAAKRLEAKQQQLAEEARRKEQQMQQARMNALGQSMLAFNPQNQMMAQMFGPQAAFTPEQFAEMAKNPIPHATPWGTGTDEERFEQVKRRDAERARQAQIRGQMTPLPAGPAPFQMRQPQAARRRG